MNKRIDSKAIGVLWLWFFTLAITCDVIISGLTLALLMFLWAIDKGK